MPAGLPVSNIVTVSVSLTPALAAFANFNSLLILGDSDVIDTRQRLRSYAALSAVATDFGTSAPEYLAAALYFAQSPAPTTLYIGRWARVATKGLLRGGVMSAAQQALANFTGIANGGFKITVDGGGQVNVTGINLTAAASLAAVAALIQTALTGAAVAATCTWDASQSQFVFRSNSTGAASQVAALVAPIAGTDLSPLILCTAGTMAYAITGIVSETAVASVAGFDTNFTTTQWYGLLFASSVAPMTDADNLAVAAYIEATTQNPHVYGLTTNVATALASGDSTSIGAQLKALKYNRTFYQYSSSSLHAAASIFGRAATVQFQGSLTTITLMFQNEPGVVAETLNQTQASALNANNYNYMAAFNNSTSFLVNGTVASGNFIDAIWGVDWLANQIQTNIFNLMLGAGTKISQTDAGMHQIATVVEGACIQGVTNGLLGPGTWNAAGFGQLKQGQFLSKGFYVFTPPISTQSAAQRSVRAAPAVQIAAKLAGAVHSASAVINVNA